MVAIPTPLVEFILLGPQDDRRQLQDSPILGDVWVWFGNHPGKQADLLIAPHRDQHAGDVARTLALAIAPELEKEEELESGPDIAFLQGLIVARLTFTEVVELLVPKTKWWANKWQSKDTDSDEKQQVEKHELESYSQESVEKILDRVLQSAKQWFPDRDISQSQEIPAMDRFIALTGLLLWADADEAKKKELRERPADAARTTETVSEVVDADQTPDTAPESSTDEGATPDIAPEAAKQKESEEEADDKTPPSTAEQIKYILKEAKASDIAPLVIEAGRRMLRKREPEGLVWQISLNRQVMPAVMRSIPAVKADAAHTLFKVNSSQIAWAVIDSGIDGSHPAFGKRVQKSYDFKNFRKIVSLSNINTALRRKTLKELQNDKNWARLKTRMSDEEADADLKKLAQDAASKGPIHWELVEKFVEIEPDTPPRSNHGTHVAGIIGASKDEAIKHAEEETFKQREQAARTRLQEAANRQLDEAKKKQIDEATFKQLEEALKKQIEETITREVDKDAVRKTIAKKSSDFGDGMCPDIQLYDFRVLGNEIKDWEFAIIASLQFIRYLNDRHNFITIHGANLSLSIPHDVRNFACGRTPICNESERLIESGVVVVAAAGNHGYKSFETKEGSYDSYAAFSITDPGNADGVITVGATHRYWPHTYGVSFFSSRGPTGDGRLKPDLVAPGERIHAPFPRPEGFDEHKPGGDWGDLDGTSMAAPHVSGAAAMLMARYSEFIGQPRRIKSILCDNATDLGRERSFQGHGMLDVLRSFQSI
jgi:serine protease AprX